MIELNKASFEKIKIPSDFRKDLSFDDWHDLLLEIKIWAEIFKARDNEYSTFKKKRTRLEKINRLSKQLADELQGAIFDKIEIVKTSGALGNVCSEQSNPDHDILACLICSDKQAKLYDLEFEINHLLKISEDSKLKLDLIPILGKGSPRKNYKDGCLDLLFKMYEFCTSKKASCYPNDYAPAGYAGAFLEFVIRMKPILKNNGMELKYTRSTIAQAIINLPPK